MGRRRSPKIHTPRHACHTRGRVSLLTTRAQDYGQGALSPNGDGDCISPSGGASQAIAASLIGPWITGNLTARSECSESNGCLRHPRRRTVTMDPVLSDEATCRGEPLATS
jgi:hypothetical protein